MHTATHTPATSDLVDSILGVSGPGATAPPSHNTSDFDAACDRRPQDSHDCGLPLGEECPEDSALALDARHIGAHSFERFEGQIVSSERVSGGAAEPASVSALEPAGSRTVLDEGLLDAAPEASFENVPAGSLELCGDGLDGSSGEVEVMSPLPPFRVCHPGTWGAQGALPVDLDPCGPRPVFGYAQHAESSQVPLGETSGGAIAVPQPLPGHRVGPLYHTCSHCSHSPDFLYRC